jgi:hypothetical protein
MGTEPVRIQVPDQLHELLLGTPVGEAVYDVKNIYRHIVSLCTFDDPAAVSGNSCR